ncbi:ammonium transporter [Halarcobacter ebronensis]|uniref:Ammonium transporter n=1 Tax=Halarcobacter ebronensis TaxID=1462615 RepID=A0A4V1LR65_9BACT|nr:ammonium transporter [Halarcobacter ebronensis]QKF83200.1 ammonium transporter, marine subtype [Halarcobacter ebronensis]RXJ67118.1 ammonium transporter [Halarcobacter ebronensis]RXK05164.1 ammonium transporter [Halarcobacter ebronensis]
MENFADVKYVLDGFLFIIMGALVMWMAAGFAMLEAGLTRSKNNATVLTKNIALFAISCIMYYFIGYNLMYGEGSSFMGSFSTISMETAADASYPAAADFFFQVVFVATSASVISGSIAERMKLWPFLIFIVILSGIIYPIQGHWSWGGSELGGLMAGFSDFAGSTIVHSVGGWAALAGVLILGARKGKYTKDGKVKPIPGSNLTLATLGTFILWLGWFGFNGGSQLALGSKADIDGIALVVADTNMAACAGAVMAALLTQLLYKKVDLTMVLNGALAGLVSCTAGPDLGMLVAFIEGLVGGVIVVFAVPFFDKLRIDDPVGALSVHLVAGIWGTLAVGIFNPEITILAQIKGIVIVGIFVFVSSIILWKILDVIMGLRVDEETEINGLDIHETGLECYPEFKKA